MKMDNREVLKKLMHLLWIVDTRDTQDWSIKAPYPTTIWFGDNDVMEIDQYEEEPFIILGHRSYDIDDLPEVYISRIIEEIERAMISQIQENAWDNAVLYHQIQDILIHWEC